MCVCVWESLRTLFCASVQVHGVRNVRHMSVAARRSQKNPHGNGGGIPVTMEMSKLIRYKIST